MDITLERILSLIPKKPDGKYVHGAKRAFAYAIGFNDGQIVSMWESGLSKSYRNYLYEISAKYDVSVEWLKGETDEKKPDTTKGIGQSFNKLTAENQEYVLSMIEKLLKSQPSD